MSTPLEQLTVKPEMPKKNDHNTTVVVDDEENDIYKVLDDYSALDAKFSEEMNNIQTEIDSTKNFTEIQKIEKEKGTSFAEPLYVELANASNVYSDSKGCRKVQEYLAKLYATGDKDVPKNIVKAFRWYNQVFNHKNEPSIKETLIKYLERAEGAILLFFRDQNFKAIKEHIEILEAETSIDYQFRTKTLYCLAKIFEEGYDGVRQDNDKAYKYCKQAVNKSYPDAFFRLGYYCELGIGTSKNIEKALKYYEKAADKHQDKDAILRLKLHKEMKSGKKHFTEKLFLANNQLITKNKEDIEAHLVVAICYIKGWGTKQNIIKGFNYISSLAKSNAVAKIYQAQFEPIYQAEYGKALEQEKFLETKRLKVLEQKALEEKRLAEQELEKKRIEDAEKAAKAKRKEEKRLQAEKEAEAEKKLAEKRDAAKKAAEAAKTRIEEEKKAAKAKRKEERKLQAENEAAEKAKKEAEATEKARQEAEARKTKAEELARKKQARKLEKEALQKQLREEQQKLLENLAAKDKKLTAELEAKRVADELAQKKLEVEEKERLLKQQSLEAQQLALKQVESQNKKLEIELEAKRVANELAQKQREVATKENLLQQQLLEKKKTHKQKKKETKMKQFVNNKKNELSLLEEHLQKSVVDLETKQLSDQISRKKAELEKNEKLLAQQQTILTSISEHSRHLTEKLQSTQLKNEIERQALKAGTLSRQLDEETRLGQHLKASLQLEHLRRQAPTFQPQFHQPQNFMPTPPAPQITPMLNQQLAYPQQPQPPVTQTVTGFPLNSLPPGTIVSPLPFVVVNVQNFTTSNNFSTQLRHGAAVSIANQPVNSINHNQQIISSNPQITSNRPNRYHL